MGIFDKTESMEKEQTAVAQRDDDQFLESMSGAGLERMDEQYLGRTFLTISQTQDLVKRRADDIGLFINRLTGEVYGNKVRLVVLSFTPCWDVKEVVNGARTGRSVSSHRVGSIQTDTIMENGRPRKAELGTSRPIDELYFYVVLLADHPEQGIFFFKPSPSSKRVLNRLNKLMTTNLLSSGNVAPSFANVYELTAGKQYQQGSDAEYGTLTDVVKAERTSKEFWLSAIKDRMDSIESINVFGIEAPEEVEVEEETEIG